MKASKTNRDRPIIETLLAANTAKVHIPSHVVDIMRRAKEKEPIMSKILKNIAALALMVGALIGSAGTSDAQILPQLQQSLWAGTGIQ